MAQGAKRDDGDRSRVRSDKRRGRRRGAARGLDGARLAAFGILALWGFSNLYVVASPAYDPPEGIHAVALAAATYLFFHKSNGGVDH